MSEISAQAEPGAIACPDFLCCEPTAGFSCVERAMVVIREGTPDPNIDGRRVGGVWCDPCIAPIISAPVSAGIPTMASCCGHNKQDGRIMLRDGRELLVKELPPDWVPVGTARPGSSGAEGGD